MKKQWKVVRFAGRLRPMSPYGMIWMLPWHGYGGYWRKPASTPPIVGTLETFGSASAPGNVAQAIARGEFAKGGA